MADTGNNIISLFGNRAKSSDDSAEQKTERIQFDEVILRNKRNQERLRQDRIKANEKVLKSYRIKKKS